MSNVFLKKAGTLLLTVALILAFMPMSSFTVFAEGEDGGLTDPSLITSFEYIPAGGVWAYQEGVDHKLYCWEYEPNTDIMFRYDGYDMEAKDGDIIKIKFSDGAEGEYVYDREAVGGGDLFIKPVDGKDDPLIDKYGGFKVAFYSAQNKTEWGLGKHTVTAILLSDEFWTSTLATDTFEAKVTENPVKSISYKPHYKEILFLNEGDSYVFHNPSYEDELTVNYTDGTSEKYKFEYAMDENNRMVRSGFYSEDNKEIEFASLEYGEPCSGCQVTCTPNFKDSTSWPVGIQKNALTMKYAGKEFHIDLEVKPKGWTPWEQMDPPVDPDPEDPTPTDTDDNSGKYKDIDAKTPSDATLKKAKTNKKLNIKAGSISTSAKTGKKTMTIKWKKVKGATNYRVAYKKAGAKKWTYKWSAGKNSLTLKKMKKNGMYEFKVQAVKKSSGKWTKSSFSKSNYRLYAATSQKVKAGKKSFTVKAKKVKGATGYQVIYSSKKNMKGSKTKTGKKPTVKITRLKKGARYYVQVRPVKKYKGKTYIGVLSSKKAVKVRK